MHVFWSESRDGFQGQHFMVDGTKTIPVRDARGRENRDLINPYGILPVTFAHRSPQLLGDFWVKGASDIVLTNKHMDIGLTELALAYRFDAVGIKWIKTRSNQEQEEITTGTDKFITLPEDADIGRLGGASLDHLVSIIKFWAEVATYNNYLQIKWANSGQNAKSGEALKIESIDNFEQREAGINDTWRKWERERYEVDKKVLKTHGVNIPDKAPSVDFAEPTMPLSRKEEREDWDWRLQKGFASPEDWYKSENPDASDEQIAKWLERVQGNQPKKGSLLSQLSAKP